MQSCASHTFILWLPTIIEALINGRALGASKAPVAKGSAAAAAATSRDKMRSVILPVILAAIPYTVGAVAAWFVATSSQKRKEVYYHAAFSMFAAGIFFILVRGC
jgi:zinc transporter ZupT